ncbi:hypothetical protein MaudCBS49596_004956 [Microsporum audouinii]
MTSIGRVAPSAVSATLESTIALANFNFDFTLFKVEPPKEFSGVGSQLSTQRRQVAESGSAHVVARKLGALFKDLIPSTPELIKAYGTRASEISKSRTLNPSGNASHGLFASSVGADATTIWAAATSGKHAISCHLLACLLARIWDAAEATSIWVEITERRRQDILTSFDSEGMGELELMVAVREKFSRADLAGWDASARAWLRVADAAKSVQQTQLRLIIDNISLPVNSKVETYQSVINAWKSSQEQMERLLNGYPQEARDGGVLLGLAAWHLYPDIILLSLGSKEIHQKDPLFERRGVLTLGLTGEGIPNREGVFWSLPLRHLRFYGLPVTRSRSINSSEQTRLTADQLLIALTAAYMRPWDDGSAPTETIVEFFTVTAGRLYDALSDVYSELPKNPEGLKKKPWLVLLYLSAKRYMEAVGQDKKFMQKLWNLGRMHCTMFGSAQPFRNIFTASTFLHAALRLEDKVALLREVAQSSKGGRSEFLIRYRYDYPISKLSRYEYTTAISEPSNKRTLNGNPKTKHIRWIWPGPVAKTTTTASAGVNEESMATSYYDGALYNTLHDDFKPFSHDLTLVEEAEEGTPMQQSPRPILEEQPTMDEFTARREQLQDIGEEVRPSTYFVASENDTRLNICSYDDFGGLEPHIQAEYVQVFGDNGNCQLFRRLVADGRKEDYKLERKLTTKMKMDLFNPEKVSFRECANILVDSIQLSDRDHDLLNLWGISTLYNLYGGLDHSTIDVRTVGIRLNISRWLTFTVDTPGLAIMLSPGSPFPDPFEMNYAASFSCIAMLETGNFDLDPLQLANVTALSSADSLYVASSLLRDPAESYHLSRVERITGNIGRPGVAFLVPPIEPMIKSYGINEWQLLDHEVFDGKFEDNFFTTSLQLSFTEATFPIDVGFSGGQDTEAYFLETLLSVLDSGQWVADIDVLKSLLSLNISRVLPCASVEMGKTSLVLTSIDCFAEIIYTPDKPGIIRASKNWQARLATTAICIAKGYSVILISDSVCWACIEIQVQKARGERPDQQVMIIS